ncbi:MAG: hypothetical protein K1X29_10460 [Bdellovibrionales bacterium]|nr:hypothetical protein [Bdellovibrionales bacterium]
MPTLIVFLLLNLLYSSQPSPASPQIQKSEPMHKKISKSNREVKVPLALIEELKKWQKINKDKENLQKTDSSHWKIDRQLLNLEMEIQFSNQDSLDKNIKYLFPTGGGLLDFAEEIFSTQGEFTLKFIVNNFEINSNNLRVFYISEARQRQLNQVTYGSGCNKWMEVSRWFHSKKQDSKLTLSISKQRYVSALSGSWIFASSIKNQLYLGALSLTDSRDNSLLCKTI